MDLFPLAAPPPPPLQRLPQMQMVSSIMNTVVMLTDGYSMSVSSWTARNLARNELKSSKSRSLAGCRDLHPNPRRQ